MLDARLRYFTCNKKRKKSTKKFFSNFFYQKIVEKGEILQQLGYRKSLEKICYANKRQKTHQKEEQKREKNAKKYRKKLISIKINENILNANFCINLYRLNIFFIFFRPKKVG